MTATSVKPYRGPAMEGRVAKWYASSTRKRIDEQKALARRIADELPPGSRVLEVAPGPGYLAIELAKMGDYRVTGLDISRTFVEIAKGNAAEAKVDVDFREGNAAAQPFENGTFDFVVCCAAFKNFSEPLKALCEFHRVLKPGGKALIVDLRRDASRKSIDEHVSLLGAGLVNSIIIKLTFRFMLLKRAYTKTELRQLAAQTPFRKSEILEDLIGMEAWLEK